MASIPTERAEYGLLSSPTSPKPSATLDIYEMNPNDLANYFIKQVSREWVGTLVKQDLKRVPTDVGHLSNSDQLVIYNPHKDCLYKFRVDQVPKEIVKELECLAHAQEFGVGGFNQLCEVLKKMIQDANMSEDPEEGFGKGVKGAVAMLAELSLQISSPAAGPDHKMITDPGDIKVHVVLVDSLGESHRYTHTLCAGIVFNSFLEEMDRKFSTFCDPYNEWAYKNWASRVQDLKDTGMDGDRTLDRIEELIALHQADKREELPQWMYYTIRSKGEDGEGMEIRNEESFKAMISMAIDQESPACLMRIAEAKFRNIFVELKFLEERQLPLACSRDKARMEDENGDQGRLQSENGVVESDDNSFFDPESLYSLTYFYKLGHDNPENLEDQQNHDDDQLNTSVARNGTNTDPSRED